jgi:hypothetical protein
MVFLWNNLCTLLYLIKIYQAHSLVWYNPNLSIVVPFNDSSVLSVSYIRGPRIKPCSLFKPFLIGVLFLVVLVCLLCMCCAWWLLRVEDRVCCSEVFEDQEYQRAREEEPQCLSKEGKWSSPPAWFYFILCNCMTTKFISIMLLH